MDASLDIINVLMRGVEEDRHGIDSINSIKELEVMTLPC